MQEKKRILIITHELSPFLEETNQSNLLLNLASKCVENDYEVRVLMPKFGVINERRHRLHEVVRLSGINITVNDEDYPLIIKVASIPKKRIQVYFMDNEDLFKRKNVYYDDENTFFADNHERMVFFCKGALETVKKFGWPPDIIHCNGWITAPIPMYLKTAYKNEAVFANSKCIYTINGGDNPEFDEDLEEVLNINDEQIPAKFLKQYVDDENGMNQGASSNADLLILSNEANGNIPADVKSKKKGVLQLDEEAQVDTVFDAYNTILEV